MKILTRGIAYLLAACASVAIPQARAQNQTPGTVAVSFNIISTPAVLASERITPANAAQLREVCRLQIDGPTTFHAGHVSSTA